MEALNLIKDSNQECRLEAKTKKYNIGEKEISEWKEDIKSADLMVNDMSTQGDNVISQSPQENGLTQEINITKEGENEKLSQGEESLIDSEEIQNKEELPRKRGPGAFKGCNMPKVNFMTKLRCAVRGIQEGLEKTTEDEIYSYSSIRRWVREFLKLGYFVLHPPSPIEEAGDPLNKWKYLYKQEVNVLPKKRLELVKEYLYKNGGRNITIFCKDRCLSLNSFKQWLKMFTQYGDRAKVFRKRTKDLYELDVVQRMNIVEESLGEGVTTTEIAAKHQITHSSIRYWKNEYFTYDGKEWKKPNEEQIKLFQDKFLALRQLHVEGGAEINAAIRRQDNKEKRKAYWKKKLEEEEEVSVSNISVSVSESNTNSIREAGRRGPPRGTPLHHANYKIKLMACVYAIQHNSYLSHLKFHFAKGTINKWKFLFIGAFLAIHPPDCCNVSSIFKRKCTKNIHGRALTPSEKLFMVERMLSKSNRQSYVQFAESNEVEYSFLMEWVTQFKIFGKSAPIFRIQGIKEELTSTLQPKPIFDSEFDIRNRIHIVAQTLTEDLNELSEKYQIPIQIFKYWRNMYFTYNEPLGKWVIPTEEDILRLENEEYLRNNTEIVNIPEEYANNLVSTLAHENNVEGSLDEKRGQQEGQDLSDDVSKSKEINKSEESTTNTTKHLDIKEEEDDEDEEEEESDVDIKLEDKMENSNSEKRSTPYEGKVSQRRTEKLTFKDKLRIAIFATKHGTKSTIFKYSIDKAKISKWSRQLNKLQKYLPKTGKQHESENIRSEQCVSEDIPSKNSDSRATDPNAYYNPKERLKIVKKALLRGPQSLTNFCIEEGIGISGLNVWIDQYNLFGKEAQIFQPKVSEVEDKDKDKDRDKQLDIGEFQVPRTNGNSLTLDLPIRERLHIVKETLEKPLNTISNKYGIPVSEIYKWKNLYFIYEKGDWREPSEEEILKLERDDYAQYLFNKNTTQREMPVESSVAPSPSYILITENKKCKRNNPGLAQLPSHMRLLAAKDAVKNGIKRVSNKIGVGKATLTRWVSAYKAFGEEDTMFKEAGDHKIGKGIKGPEFTREQKIKILQEGMQDSFAVAAYKNGVCAGRLTKWRKELVDFSGDTLLFKGDEKTSI